MCVVGPSVEVGPEEVMVADGAHSSGVKVGAEMEKVLLRQPHAETLQHLGDRNTADWLLGVSVCASVCV